MSDRPSMAQLFDADHAAIYDQRFAALHPIKDLLHLILHAHFGALPADARILVVGAGTAAEVRYLAPLHPGWRFTLVDPAPAMLDVARQHAEAEGFAERCTFHVGFVSSLPETPHDAATSLLVSQFLTDADDRQAYFRDIAARLKPGGLLFDADLAAERDGPDFEAVMALWLDLMGLADGMGPEQRANYIAKFGQWVAAHGPAQVEGMIEAAGFTRPARVYQAGLIQGWIAARGGA